MKLVEFVPPRPHPLWKLCLQMGITDVIVKVKDCDPEKAIADLAAAGLRVVGFEGDMFDMSPIKEGLPNRDEAIAKYLKYLELMAKHGIRLLCYNFMVGTGWARTGVREGRGGAKATYFSLTSGEGAASTLKLTKEQVWANYEYFLRAVMPTAERLGIRMGLHPDDPCLDALGGYARIFGSVEAFDRAYAICPSASNAVTFCQANFKLMGADLVETAKHFGKRIAFVHVRDVEGDKTDFTELFHDQGTTDQFALMRTYRALGLDVPVRGDHVPEMEGDSLLTSNCEPGYFTLGRLFANGYLKALLKGTKALLAVAAALMAGTVSAEALKGYSMVTHDGRRMVSRTVDGKEVFELMPTNALPAGLKPVRPWELYVVKASHTDIGLHNSQYIQRHGSIWRIEEAIKAIDADTRADDDPAAFRYLMEGTWFWENYVMDRGEAAARNVVTNYIARGRLGVSACCAGNMTHVYSPVEIERSVNFKRRLAEKWGLDVKTMVMADYPGVSWSVVSPYVRADIENLFFAPNKYNPLPTTIWPRHPTLRWDPWNPDSGAGGNRIDVGYESKVPMLFWWESPDGKDRMLVWSSTIYGDAYSRMGLNPWPDPVTALPAAEKKAPAFLDLLESRVPYDIWLGGAYGDDEYVNTRFANFAAKWNAKWATPTFHIVGDLDEPFEKVRARFGDRIPVLRGEMTSGWAQLVNAAPDLLADKFEADRTLELAERLGERAGTLDRTSVDAAWQYLIYNDEHSYGVSGYVGRRIFETWMQHRDWIERASAIASNELRKATAKLGIRPAGTPGEEVRPGTTAENRFYRVTVNAKGELASLYDKELKRELLGGPANRLLYTRDNHRSWADAAQLGAEIVQRVFLPRDVKRVDVSTEIRHATDLYNRDRFKRYGYLSFPFAVPGGRFTAHLNGVTMEPYREAHPLITDAYVAVRDWCKVENGEFGVGLMSRDSTLTEFGEIHPDKTCYTGVPPADKSAIYPLLFNDWLQSHHASGETMDFTFRFAITSFAKGRDDLDRAAEDWLNPYAAWMREHAVGPVSRDRFADQPADWTGLITSPRASHGEKDGQMYLLWGAEMSPAFDHYEIYRSERPDGGFEKIANVTNEAPIGIPYRVARYVDLGLGSHRRYWYRLRKVYRDHAEELGPVFSGVTRYVSEDERTTYRGGSEFGWLGVRYVGAHTISWKPATLKGEEVLFMPTNCPCGGEVRGGISVCWPWFGESAGKRKDGFANCLPWTLKEIRGKDHFIFTLDSSEETKRHWPHDFHLELQVQVTSGDSLRLALTETNTGREPFESAWGFRPHFRISDPSAVSVRCEDAEDWQGSNPGVRTPRKLGPGESRTHEMSVTVRAESTSPCDLDFKLVHERRFQLDLTRPMESCTFLPGAQYTATVKSLPAAVRFVTADGEERFRYSLAADSAAWPAPPFELSLLVSGRAKVGVYTGTGTTAKLVELVEPGTNFNPCLSENVRTLHFAAEGGATNPRARLSAGIGQADIRFVTEGRENRPYVENGRFFFTFSARSYGSWLGVMSIDPRHPSDLRLEGAVFFDYGDGLVRNDVAADIFHDSAEGNWKAYVSNFSTGADSGTKGRAVGGINVAWSEECPLHGVHVMKAKSLGLPGMNEDPDGIWDAAAGKWRLLLSEFAPGAIRASMWESAAWDGPFVRLTDPVGVDSTGTTILPFGARRFCVFGSVDRACYVRSYPSLEPVGALKFDVPPWPTGEGVGYPHGRVWPAIAAFEADGRRRYLLVTMDRVNFPGMPTPNWTYGKLMVYVADGTAVWAPE